VPEARGNFGAKLVASARLFRIPSLWIDGSHKSEGPASMVGVEMVEEVARAQFAFAAQRILQPSAGQTDRQTAEHAQHRHGFGRAHPASIFIQGGVQSLMPRFNAPVAPTTPQ
jgi:hypothetical protein